MYWLKIVTERATNCNAYLGWMLKLSGWYWRVSPTHWAGMASWNPRKQCPKASWDTTTLTRAPPTKRPQWKGQASREYLAQHPSRSRGKSGRIFPHRRCTPDRISRVCIWQISTFHCTRRALWWQCVPRQKSNKFSVRLWAWEWQQIAEHILALFPRWRSTWLSDPSRPSRKCF